MSSEVQADDTFAQCIVGCLDLCVIPTADSPNADTRMSSKTNSVYPEYAEFPKQQNVTNTYIAFIVS